MNDDLYGKPLTRRQRQVIQLLCEQCLSNKEVAAVLEISVKTVEKHRQVIHKKLGVRCVASMAKRYWHTPELQAEQVLALRFG